MTTTTAKGATNATATTVAAGIPSLPAGRTIRLGVSRIGYEVMTYFRQGDTIFFTFLFPVLMLGIFSVAFSGMPKIGALPDGTGGITYAAYYLPGMMAAGILLSGVQNLAVDIANEKSDGTLKRLGGSPLPVLSYFFGKMGQVLVTSVMQLIVLMAVAALAFGVKLPTDPSKWLTLLWVYLLGITTSAVLGIALSAVPRSGRSATAVVIPIVLILQFISGVYLQFSVLPTWLQNIASVFPLKWMAQGMRSVFLPDRFRVLEQGHEWNLGWVAIVLAIWLVFGLIACRLTFRWIRKDR
jgi:ABC-2 type transport system permease protein